MLDKRGKLYSYFHQIGGSDPLIRQKQYDTFRDESILEIFASGLYHRNHESHLALIYDMIEPFRHLIDRSVFEIQDQIRKKDYCFSREGIVVLSDDLKRKYIVLLSTIFDRKRLYVAKTGIKRKDGYQRMEEVTVMKIRCVELRALLLNSYSR